MNSKIVGDIETSFPKLMIDKSAMVVVMFFENGRGTSVYRQDGFILEYSEDWDMRVFKDFTGCIELRNE